MEYHIYYGDELLRFQTGTSKMEESIKYGWKI